MNKIKLDFSKTALVLIDLQEGIVNMTQGFDVVKKSKQLVDIFRENNGFITFVHVDFHDNMDKLNPITDNETLSNSEESKNWSKFCSELDVRKEDYKVKKRQWGAFFGTDLDLELRRRNINTIVLCGISTNIGVESTARQAYERGYNQIFIEDAMKAATNEVHNCTVKNIFTRIGRVRKTNDFINEVI